MTRWLGAVLAALLLGFGVPAAGAPSAAQRVQGDVALYQDVAHKVAHGESYYRAVDELYRQRHYPTRPFVAVRPPTLAWIEAAAGDAAMPWLGLAAMLATMALWLWRLRSDSFWVRLLAGAAVLGTGVPLAFSPFVYVHDFWSGIAISCALACPGPRGRALFGLIAVCLRELCFPFLWVLVALEKNRRPVLAACVTAVVLLTLHALSIVPGGYHSQGWGAMRGPVAALDDLAGLTVLQFAPRTVALVLCVAPLLGWMHDRVALAWLVGFAAMIAILARVDNLNWPLNLLPAWFIGYAQLGRSFPKSLNLSGSPPPGAAKSSGLCQSKCTGW